MRTRSPKQLSAVENVKTTIDWLETISYRHVLGFNTAANALLGIPNLIIFQDGSSPSFSSTFSYISFSSFTLPSLSSLIYCYFFSDFLSIFILLSSDNNNVENLYFFLFLSSINLVTSLNLTIFFSSINYLSELRDTLRSRYLILLFNEKK